MRSAMGMKSDAKIRRSANMSGIIFDRLTSLEGGDELMRYVWAMVEACG